MPDTYDLLHRPVLLGLPADKSCAAVVAVAYQLARILDAPLEMLHAVPPASLLASGFRGDRAKEHDQERRDRAEAHFTNLLDGITGAPAKSVDMLRVVTGHSTRALLERASELDAGLVLVGPHRRRGVFDLGSTARALLSHSPCAVWSQVGVWEDIERLLVPTDLSTPSEHALQVAKRLAHRLEVPMHLVHAYMPWPDPYPPAGSLLRDGMPSPPKGLDAQLREETEANFDAQIAKLKSEGLKVTGELLDEKPVGAIHARQERGVLTVMATHGRGKLSSAVLGSVTYGVLRGAEGPVLAVPQPEDSGERAKLSVDDFHTTV